MTNLRSIKGRKPDEPKTTTFREMYLDNAKLVKEAIETHGLEDEAAVNLFAVTLNGHLQLQQIAALRAPTDD